MNSIKKLITKAKKFYDDKNFFEAKTYLLKALKDAKIDEKLKLTLYYLIADICYKVNDFIDAENYLLKYIKYDKSNSKIFNFLGNVCLKKRNYKNSEKFYIKSINLDNDNEIALTNLAVLYQNLGNQKNAASLYKKILKKNPKNIGALYNLSNIDKTIINKENILKLNDLVNKKELTNFNIASSYFLLADNEKNKKNFEEEINLLSKANDYSFRVNDNINKQSNEYWLKIIPNKFNKIYYKNDEKYFTEVENFFPIFIVGLPRCGSTLIESIISSGKNEVENLGETNLVNWAFLNTNRGILEFSKNMNEKEKIKINFDETAKKLKKAFNNMNIKEKSEKIIFLEKSLENFFYIELILNIYPNAKFINPYRNLIDNTFAIYKQFLSNISWSHSIDNILLYIDNYLTIIDFFKKKYPDKIYSISLENFTKNPKQISMNIFNFCNLEWDEKCLEFYKRKDLFSNTASNNQIRASVQKYDQSKYQAYRQILKDYQKKYNWIHKIL
tara:strand:+ start:1447 stop:2949 length:1503 start_codon:yes stop_codon:yes gene_type:complete